MATDFTGLAAAGDEAALTDALCAVLASRVGAVKGRALSKDAVLVDGKIVAFVSRGRLVVKLPPDRRADLIAQRVATPMRMGARVMKEWVSVDAAIAARWPALAEESARFVAASAAR